MLPIGEPAPDFALDDADSRTIRLSDLLQNGPVVVFFYPADFSPVCTRQACMVRDLFGELKQVGVQAVGISSQSSTLHKRFQKHLNLPYPLLADPGRKVARTWGATSFGGLWPRRVSYLIDADGRIADRERADLNVTRHRQFIERVRSRYTSHPPDANLGQP